MPAFDINAILSAALATAVAEAIEPLLERIGSLEKNEEYLVKRIAALENNPAQGVDTTLERRIAALETHTTVLDQHGGLLEALDNQEWFWHKVAGFITNNSEITANDVEVLNDRVTALEGSAGLTRKDVEALIEQSMDHHLECYDHDEYDSHIDDNDKHFEGDIEDAVRDALSNMTFDVSIR